MTQLTSSPLSNSYQYNVAQGQVQPSNAPINNDGSYVGFQQPSIPSSNATPTGSFMGHANFNGAQAQPQWSPQAGTPSSPTPSSQSPRSAPPSTQQIITPDLRNGVVRQFALSPASQQLLGGMEQMIKSLTIHNPELATIPRYLFYVLGAVLKLNDTMAAHLASMPTAQEIRSSYDRILGMLDQGEAFVVKECHTKIIRAVANNIMFSKDHLEMDATARKVMAYLQSHNVQLNLAEAFTNPINQAELNRAVKRTVSSVLSAFRTDLRSGANAQKTTAQSLVSFTKMAHMKYTAGATDPVRIEKGNIIRFALFRGFLFDRPEMLGNTTAANAVNKRARTDQLESHSSESEGSEVSAGTLIDVNGEVVPEPAMPNKAHFFPVLEWWLDCRRIEYGNDMNSPAWKGYIRRLLAFDTARFPHPASDPSPSASLALHHALVWAGAITQDENYDPAAAQNSQTPPPSAPPVDFSSLQFGDQ